MCTAIAVVGSLLGVALNLSVQLGVALNLLHEVLSLYGIVVRDITTVVSCQNLP
jgi:hypothetical protein